MAAALCGCAGAVQPAGGTYTDDQFGIRIDTPQGWYRLAGAPRGSIILTKNGIELDAITVGRFDLGQKLPDSPKRYEAGMTPAQACDVDISNHEFAPGVNGFKLLDRGVAVIDGRDCFHYSYSYLESSGQPRAVKDYGCIVGNELYRFHYTAPVETWFPRYLPTFEQLVSSVRFSASSPASAPP